MYTDESISRLYNEEEETTSHIIFEYFVMAISRMNFWEDTTP